jgi:hypothetical protein
MIIAFSNACYFNLGARLARFTGNKTYAEEATKTWDWLSNTGLLTTNGEAFDGAHTEKNCTDINKTQFSYSAAILTQGAAFMYNYVSLAYRSVFLFLSFLLSSPFAYSSQVSASETNKCRPMALPTGRAASRHSRGL